MQEAHWVCLAFDWVLYSILICPKMLAMSSSRSLSWPVALQLGYIYGVG